MPEEKRGNKKHESFMLEALIESRKASSFSSPNPHIGAVVVKNNKIISRGHTQVPGKSHAEVMAIRRAGSRAVGSSLYVTLEPCCHFGRTSPCTDLIIKSKIKNVYIGMKDPNPCVKGKGVALLRRNKINVYPDILKKDVEEELQWYIKTVDRKRPYYTVKAGISFDGKISDYHGDSKWITSSKARTLNQKLRKNNDAIVVGIETILKDDPLLTFRGKDKKMFFVRVVLDTNLRISLKARVLKRVKNHPVIIAVKKNIKNFKKVRQLQSMGIEILFCDCRENRIDLKDLDKQLGLKGISRVIVEGGSSVHYSYIKENLVDRIMLFISSKLLGGDSSKGWIGGRGFPLNKNKKIEKGKFINIFKDEYFFEGYMKYYVYRNN